ncbi:amphi-Trp domain-containing protein [Ketobacter sp.]|uniref:amphi-Trp domain-containing protein n=1 Tax=Ketobacter sp. TaxID=2083498 RepID=UPI000F1E2E4B|nr:amphi-Trp domain-containing protein [Ketobacter sp.]RLT95060.1 MAG: amphi-Trp domain-containing protein [Ketobacter sp.]
MAQIKNSFKHESLQDQKSIQDILKAVTKGIAKGELVFSDDEGEIVLQPEGLLALKVSARQEDGQNRLDIRIRWQSEEQEIQRKPLAVNKRK